MPRRNVIKIKRPSKQLKRRRRNRLNRRRDIVSTNRHQMTAANPNHQVNARRILKPKEQLALQNVTSGDPAYAAMVAEAYEDIADMPMELLVGGNESLVGGGKNLSNSTSLSQEDYLELDPRYEASLRLIGGPLNSTLADHTNEDNDNDNNNNNAHNAQNEQNDAQSVEDEVVDDLSGLKMTKLKERAKEVGMKNKHYVNFKAKNGTADLKQLRTLIRSHVASTSNFSKTSLSMHDTDDTKETDKCGQPGLHEQVLWDDAERIERLSTAKLEELFASKNVICDDTLSLKEKEERWQIVEHLADKDIPEEYRSKPYVYQPTLEDFNHVLNVCAVHGDSDYAIEIFESMALLDIEPNKDTFVALGSVYQKNGDVEGSEAVVQLWRQTFGIGESIALSTSHVITLSNAGQIEEAEQYFQSTLDNLRHPLTQKVVDLDPPLVNAMICGYTENQMYDKAWQLYYEMQRNICLPDDDTYAAVIDICAMQGKSEQAMGFIDEMERVGFTATKLALNGVVKACALDDPTPHQLIKGDMRTAKDVIRRTGEAFNNYVGYGYEPDRDTYAALMTANSRMGRPGGCLRVLTDMVIHENIPPDQTFCNHLIMSYANAATVGRTEAKRAKKIAQLYIKREQKYTLFGRSLDGFIADSNERLSARNFNPGDGIYDEFSTEFLDPNFLVGTADAKSNMEEASNKQLQLSDSGLLQPHQIGQDVDDILNLLDSGAHLIDPLNVEDEEDGEDEEDEEDEEDGVMKQIESNSGNTGNSDGGSDGGSDGDDGEQQENKSTIPIDEINEIMANLTIEMNGTTNATSNDLVVSEEWNDDGKELNDDEEFEIYMSHWGDSLSTLVRSAHTDIHFKDGDIDPKLTKLLDGADAVFNWMRSEDIQPNIETMNAYLSVYARTLYTKRTWELLQSFEKKYDISPDTHTVSIMLEMLVTGKQLDRALCFFRVATGTEDLCSELEEYTRSKLEKYIATRFQKKANLTKEAKEQTSYIDTPNAKQYGILIRGCSMVDRFDDAANLVREMELQGMTPHDDDTFLLRRKILMMENETLSDAEDYIIKILGDSFAKRVNGYRFGYNADQKRKIIGEETFYNQLEERKTNQMVQKFKNKKGFKNPKIRVRDHR